VLEDESAVMLEQLVMVGIFEWAYLAVTKEKAKSVTIEVNGSALYPLGGS